MLKQEPVVVTIRCLTYNQKPYIRQCLEGFVMQKTNFRFEAIVHDDASTDGTVAIIQEYAEKYPDIIKPIYEAENQYSKHDGSLMRIMNEHTRGKYIAWCEGDDYWIDPLKLQKQVDFLESHSDYTLCFHQVYEELPDGTRTHDLFKHLKEGECFVTDIYEKWSVPTCSSLYKKEIMNKRPVDSRFIVGDLINFLTCAMYGRMYCMKDVMGVYRRLDTGWVRMNTNTYSFAKKRIAYHQALEEHFLAFKQLIHPSIVESYVYATLKSLKSKPIDFIPLFCKGISSFGFDYMKEMVRMLCEKNNKA